MKQSTKNCYLTCFIVKTNEDNKKRLVKLAFFVNMLNYLTS